MHDILNIRTVEDLKDAAASGGVSYKGKRLVVDLYTPTRLELRCEPTDSGVEVVAWVVSGKREWPLVESDWITARDQGWVVKGMLLRVFSDTLGNAPLQKFIDKPVRQLLRERAERYFEEWREDEVALVGSERMTPDDAPPRLELTDNYGMGARLPDLAWEADLLEAGYEKRVLEDADYYCRSDRVRSVLGFLLELGWEVVDPMGRRVQLVAPPRVEVSVRGDHLYLKATAGEIPKLPHGSGPFIPLKEGVGLLTNDRLWRDILSAGERVADSVRLPRSQVALLDDTALDLSGGKDWEALRNVMRNLDAEGEVTPSADFKAQLRPYQQQGLQWLHRLSRLGLGALLADDMGLGKTVQVLAWASLAVGDGPLLVVAPRSLLFHWRREAERFFPSLPVHVHHGSERGQLPTGRHLVVTSYGTLRADSGAFEAVEWDAVVLDEAQRIKNPRSQTAQTACRLRATFRLALSGTPVENHLGELWSIYRFLLSDLLGPQPAFEKLEIDQVRRRIRPFLLRRTKAKVARDLPEKIEQEVWVELSSDQEEHYARLLTEFKQGLLRKVSVDGLAKHRMEVFEAILRLRQICCSPLLIGEEGSSAKIQAIQADILEALEEGSQVLVCSQFTQFLTLLAKELDVPYLRLDGSTRNREEVVDRFQSGECKLLFMSLKAGGVGLNLTAADYVFLADPWWNSAAEQQAIDRAHRIGREAPVIARRYLTTESIEERVQLLKQKKDSIVDALFEGEVELPTQLSEADLHALF